MPSTPLSSLKPLHRGFSLVELSIVLVILGLLTGGILAGQSLIRGAELNKLARNFSTYRAAAYTFRDKYMALPGDMANATRFWGDNNAECPDAAIPDGSPGTCNGTGDGLIGAPNAGAPSNMGVGHTAEMWQFWNQLALAGLIEGRYSGISDATIAFGWGCTAGTHCPSNSGMPGKWVVSSYVGAYNASIDFNFTDMGTWIGASAITPKDFGGRLLAPEEGWNLDTKFDDGQPAKGSFRTKYYNDCTTGANSMDFNATYALNNTSKACNPMMKLF